MPTAACHSFFWAGSADAPAPPDPPTSGSQVSYPTWQTTITIGSGFGVLQAVYDRWRPSVTTTQVRDDGNHR